MRSMTAASTSFHAAATAIGLATFSALAQDCPEPPFQPVPDGDAYVQTYADSAEAAMSLQTIRPEDIPFERLRVMDPDNAGPLEFIGWTTNPNTGRLIEIPVVIEHPVLVVTLSAINWQQTCIDGNFTWLGYRQLQRYTCRCDSNGGNIWFTLDGNMRDYLKDDLQVDLSCLNPANDPLYSYTPCNNAIFWGVPSVGMPFAFGPLEPDPFVNPGAGAWWQQFVMVAVADRSSFVRPSYNPTVGPGTADMPTDGGVPIFDNTLNVPRYRLAQPGEPTYAAQQEILKDFMGYIYTTDPPTPPNCETKLGGCGGTQNHYIGPEGFELWLRDWEIMSWGGSSGSDQNPFDLFPFTGIGLTGDWATWGSSSEPTEQSMPALSEFILKGDKHVYVLGTWPVAQYLTETSDGQVPWCDSCEGDLNFDGHVNEIDLDILLSLWGTPNTCANLDRTEPVVEGGTLLRLLSQWGECPEWPFPDFRPASCN